MTTRTERIDFLNLQMDGLFEQWQRRTGATYRGLRQDDRVQEAISLLADVLVADHDDGGDHIPDVTFIDYDGDWTLGNKE